MARNTQNLDTVVAQLKTRQHSLTTEENKYDFSALLAFSLGLAMMLGIALVAQSGSLVDFGLFLILLSFFHLWEYLYVSVFHPEALSYECATLNTFPFVHLEVQNSANKSSSHPDTETNSLHAHPLPRIPHCDGRGVFRVLCGVVFLPWTQRAHVDLRNRVHNRHRRSDHQNDGHGDRRCQLPPHGSSMSSYISFTPD